MQKPTSAPSAQTSPEPHKPTDTLLEHYRQHGLPMIKKNGKERRLTSKEVVTDIIDLVRERIRVLDEIEPYFLSDAEQVERRIITHLAARLNIRIQDGFPPPETLPMERELREKIQKVAPTTLEGIERTLAEFTFAQKEGISRRVRTTVMRLIFQLFSKEPRDILKALVSPTIQKFLTEDEYFILFSQMPKGTWNALTQNFLMANHFEALDEAARSSLVTAIEDIPQLREVLLRITSERIIPLLSEQTFLSLIELTASKEYTELLAKLLFHRYKDSENMTSAPINAMIDVMDKNVSYILNQMPKYIMQIPEESRGSIHWKKIFQHMKQGNIFFANFWHLFPKNIINVEVWDRVVEAALLQRHESVILDVIDRMPQHAISQETRNRLIQIALERGWNDYVYRQLLGKFR